MLSLARENNVPLVFVRVQRRPDADGTVPGSASLDRYLKDLRDYLAGSDVGFIDMNGDPEVRFEHYAGVLDHISTFYIARYTEIFFQRASEYIDP
jgi:hypothetical protein